MVNINTNKSNYKQKLNNIKKSIRVGDYINCSTGHYKKWLKVISVKTLDEPILNRPNVTLAISAKRIDSNTVDRSNKILYIADILQFALVEESS